MSSTSSENRIRQIAILVSIVDSAAARQLMMHLPTETAKQVRAMASRLGPVSASERQTILADFQKSASGVKPPSSLTTAGNPTKPTESVGAARGAASSEVINDQQYAKQPADDNGLELSVSAAPWTKFSIPALIRFIRDERPAVIAVVVSQLEPQVGAGVLRALDRQVSRDVIRRLASLQDIDPEAKAAIDEHLSLRVGECQPMIDNERENALRLKALIEFAPAELQRDWQNAWNNEDTSEPSKPTQAEPIDANSNLNLKAGASLPPFDVYHEPATQPHPNVQSFFEDSQRSSPQTHTHSGDPQATNRPENQLGATVPIQKEHAARPDELFNNPTRVELDPVTRARNQRRFESILELPTHLLASLLSEAESETVLLALAGASPGFMNRFFKMLDRKDAKALDRRLRSIGAMKISDIDEAQMRIAEKAAALAAIRDTRNYSEVARAA